jgi:HD-GYP domain-containing protein (c-di-GMP phosphodiesterase class II)
MSTHTRDIDVAGLRIGMYVSQLDRPWLETPFLFQGFFIRSSNEIDELRRHCDSVQIDLEQSDIAAGETQRAKALRQSKPATRYSALTSKSGFWQRLLRLFKRKERETVDTRRPGEYYENIVDVADELVVARSVHANALHQLMGVLEEIRSGTTIRMPDLEVIISGMVDSVLRNNIAMALLIRMQKTDDYTHAHSLASSMWALVFGRHLGLDRGSLQAIGLGGLLLDVGKTKLPKELLQKKDALTDVEQMHVQNHVNFGLEIICEADSVDKRVLDMVATHHERFDGSGYPKGLRASQIPVFGRIGGIVDSYAAMTSNRPYAKAMSTYDAMREFKSLSDKSYQAELVEQFIQAIGIFPAGTLVELNTGEIGVVLKEHRDSRLRPEVAIILDANKQTLDDFRVVDLQDEPSNSSNSLDLWIKRGVKPGTYDINPDDYFL